MKLLTVTQPPSLFFHTSSIKHLEMVFAFSVIFIVGLGTMGNHEVLRIVPEFLAEVQPLVVAAVVSEAALSSSYIFS